ncbi:hypothetical protein BJX66DRAFT_315125 [Aspergillus keveii]|uniref:Kinesin light chain n=1 Tax=Aspergillus keveii TaxID=714993 RepID=A0ABR4FQ00_9EURO
MSKAALGPEHPVTLTNIANLASITRKQGQSEEAERMLLQVVETSRAVLGSEQFVTLTSMHILALTFSDQGRWKEAEELELPVTTILDTILAWTREQTLTRSVVNMAMLFRPRLWEAIKKFS